jgi:hypothetical protein
MRTAGEKYKFLMLVLLFIEKIKSTVCLATGKLKEAGFANARQLVW